MNNQNLTSQKPLAENPVNVNVNGAVISPLAALEIKTLQDRNNYYANQFLACIASVVCEIISNCDIDRDECQKHRSILIRLARMYEFFSRMEADKTT